jgi:hypothetical protein
MKVQELLQDLACKRIRLALEGESIRISAPPGEITDEIRTLVVSHKPRLIKYLHRLAEEKDDQSKYPARPYFNTRGDLVIPANSLPRYWYWAGGQSVSATLAEMSGSARKLRRTIISRN